MARTQEFVSLDDILDQASFISIPEQRDDFDTVAYIESLPEAYYKEAPAEVLTARSEDISAVSCLEEIRIAAELKFAGCYDRLQRHGFEPRFTPPEIFSDMDKVIDSQRADQSIKITAADAEEQVMQAYKDASIHTVIRKVASGEETNIDAVKKYLENNPVSDGAKVSIAKTFVEHIGGQIKATHEAMTPAEKQLHARQSLLLTELAKVSIGHVSVTAEKELPPVADLRQEFDFLKQVSQEPVRLADYDGRQRGRFTKKATQIVLNSVFAAFSVHAGVETPPVATEAGKALVNAAPISASTAEKLIDAVSGEEESKTAKNVIAEIVAPHETKNKLVAAANLKLLTVAVEEEIRHKTGKEPVVPSIESDNMTVNMYLMVADKYVDENGPQMPEDQRQLLTDYAQFMKTIVANNDRLPEGLAQTIVEMAPEGYVTTLRDMAIESVSEGNTDAANVLMATMFANLDAIVHPSAAEQDKLLAEIMNEPDYNTDEVTPPPQPAPQLPPEVVPTPPSEVTPTPPPAEQAPKDEIAEKLTYDAVATILKGAPRENIEKYTSMLLNAMKEQNIYDVHMVAYAFGTINAETARFAPIPEYASGEDYEGREDLGNIHPGDGVRYKGRGFIQLTGRNNYRHYGQILNLDLEGNPDLALEPETAARILAVYLAGKAEKIRHALIDHKDLALARKHVNGGTNGLKEMSDGYLAALAVFGIEFEADKKTSECADKIKHTKSQVKKDLMEKYNCVSGNLSPEELVQLGDEWGNEAINPVGLQGFKNMAAAYAAHFGKAMKINDSYRSYDEQVETKRRKEAEGKGRQAATPGKSEHGWGFALDFGGGVNQFGSAEHEWMKANASRFGWVHPDWAKADGSNPEAWHWEYAGGGSEESAPQPAEPLKAETVVVPSPMPTPIVAPAPEETETDDKSEEKADKENNGNNGNNGNNDDKDKGENGNKSDRANDKSDKDDDEGFLSSITGAFTD